MSAMEQKALEILARIAGHEVADLKPGQDLVADLGIDSPKVLELICDIEDLCEIEVPDDTVGEMATVADLLAMVRASTPLAVEA